MAEYAHTPGSNYADPGFQADKKKRYPLDTADKVRAAWSYINMPRNSSKYQGDHLAHIKGKIKAAAEKFGIDIGDKAKSSVVTAEVSSVQPKIAAPDSTPTHFFTAGRMITYNEPNLNGLVFFREDCQPVIETLSHSLADIAHVKPGNGMPSVRGQNNLSIGSIYDVHEDDEGIDIVCKNDRDAVNHLGFTEDDFKPLEGTYATFSQESDFSPNSSPVIAVKPGILHNINPDKDIAYEVHPDEARARGLSTSYFDSNLGKWIYNHDEQGNTLFIRLRPISFSGVGHVINPADQNAMIYSYAASQEGEKVIASLYPRSTSDTYPSLDDPGYLPPGPDSIAAGGSVDMSEAAFDTGYTNDDFMKHPDLSGAGCDYFSMSDMSDDDEDDRPDDHYAVLFYDNNKSHDPTDPTDSDFSAVGDPVKRRFFRVKDKRGNFDRDRLISAYHALCGMRGNTHVVKNLPPNVAKHALAVIRQGLDQTNPKERQMSEIKNPGLEQDIAALEERAKILSQEKETASAAYQSLSQEFTDFKTAQSELASAKDVEIETLKATLKELTDKALCSQRLSALETILAFSDEEKSAENFEEFVKSLASITDDRFETMLLKRELVKAKSQVEETKKSLSSIAGGKKLSPAPSFIDENGAYKKPSIADIL